MEHDKSIGDFVVRVTVDIPISVLIDFMETNKFQINNSELYSKMFRKEISLVDDLDSPIPSDKVQSCYNAVLSALANGLNIKK